MQRAREEAVASVLFDDPSRVHDEHPIANGGSEVQIVSDEEAPTPTLATQPRKKSNDLCLCSDVEGGRRLVGDDEFRIGSESAGDHYPLQHPARDFGRIGAKHCVPDRRSQRWQAARAPRSSPPLS